MELQQLFWIGICFLVSFVLTKWQALVANRKGTAGDISSQQYDN
jgi:hypothetical protein